MLSNAKILAYNRLYRILDHVSCLIKYITNFADVTTSVLLVILPIDTSIWAIKAGWKRRSGSWKPIQKHTTGKTLTPAVEVKMHQLCSLLCKWIVHYQLDKFWLSMMTQRAIHTVLWLKMVRVRMLAQLHQPMELSGWLAMILRSLEPPTLS